MTLLDLASLGSFVSGVGVILSLIYLALQVHQTGRNQRAIIHQGSIAQSSDRLLRFAEPTLAIAYLKGLLGRAPSEEEVEFMQFTGLLGAILRSVEDTYYQRDLGLLDERALQNQLAPLQGILASPRAKAFWRVIKGSYDPRFVERVDAINNVTSARLEYGPFEAFKRELGSVLADESQRT